MKAIICVHADVKKAGLVCDHLKKKQSGYYQAEKGKGRWRFW